MDQFSFATKVMSAIARATDTRIIVSASRAARAVPDSSLAGAQKAPLVDFACAAVSEVV